MVYCGKPSKACDACRAKRTKVRESVALKLQIIEKYLLIIDRYKCDQAIPTCGQCRRAHRECAYRSAQDLLFRNETNHVVGKAQALQPVSSRTSSSSPPSEFTVLPEDFDFNDLEDLRDSPQVEDILPIAYNHAFSPRSLVISLEDQACSFFFHHYVTEGATPPTSFPAFLPKLFNQPALGSVANPLPEIVTAVGMAGISNMQNSPAGMIATRQKHTNSLRALNAALRDPSMASTDATMMAIMLLGTFEVGLHISRKPVIF